MSIGHWHDPIGVTGCTVLLPIAGAMRAGVAVAGGAPGTRETDLLAPTATASEVHARLLTGGSAFGLDAAGGVMTYLRERGIGFETGVARVPIVPAAVIFDLDNGDTIFALSTGERTASLDVLGVVAVEVVAAAIRRAVVTATGLAGVPAASELDQQAANERT